MGDDDCQLELKHDTDVTTHFTYAVSHSFDVKQKYSVNKWFYCRLWDCGLESLVDYPLYLEFLVAISHEDRQDIEKLLLLGFWVG